MSDASRRRLALVARNVEGLTHLATLTLPGEWLELVPDGPTLKRLWSAMRKALVRAGRGGLWFLEFQRRGAPHLHILLDGPVNRRWLSATWYRVVGSADRDHLGAGTNIQKLRKVDGGARYVAKYAAKAEQKLVPAYFLGVGRMWGLFGGVRVDRLELRGQLLEDRDPAGPARVARVIRKLHQARERDKGRAFDDGGWHGWTAYDLGPGIRRYLAWARGPNGPTSEIVGHGLRLR